MCKSLHPQIGFEWSYRLYVLMLLGAYVSGLFIAAVQHWGCCSVLLSAPLAVQIAREFRAKVDSMTSPFAKRKSTLHGQKMMEITEKTAQLHLFYGALLLLGVLCT
jgi:1,4-dihydroxy-2-naphthoate octaprenyltransferase